MTDARQVARWIVDEIVHDLRGRKGLDNEWDAIDEDVRGEIVNSWLDATEDFVKRYEPER